MVFCCWPCSHHHILYLTNRKGCLHHCYSTCEPNQGSLGKQETCVFKETKLRSAFTLVQAKHPRPGPTSTKSLFIKTNRNFSCFGGALINATVRPSAYCRTTVELLMFLCRNTSSLNCILLLHIATKYFINMCQYALLCLLTVYLMKS